MSEIERFYEYRDGELEIYIRYLNDTFALTTGVACPDIKYELLVMNKGFISYWNDFDNEKPSELYTAEGVINFITEQGYPKDENLNEIIREIF